MIKLSGKDLDKKAYSTKNIFFSFSLSPKSIKLYFELFIILLFIKLKDEVDKIIFSNFKIMLSTAFIFHNMPLLLLELFKSFTFLVIIYLPI